MGSERLVLQRLRDGDLDLHAARVTQRNHIDLAAWCEGEAFDVGMAPGLGYAVRVPGCGRWANVGMWIVDLRDRFCVVDTEDQARVLLALGSYFGCGSTTSVAADCNRARPWREPKMTNRVAIRVCRDLAFKGMVVESGKKRGPKCWSLPALPVEETKR